MQSEDKVEVVYSLIYERDRTLNTFNDNETDNFEKLTLKYDELCSTILKLPKSIVSTHLFNNFVFNLHIEFIGFDYVKISYKSPTIILIEAGLNLDNSLYYNIHQILSWLDINKFKINILANRYNIPSQVIKT